MPIRGGALTALALLLHEFATNAAKYGALSSPTGRLLVAVAIRDGMVQVAWSESGGPALTGAAAAEGFGSRLEHATMRGQLQGAIERVWRTEGLVIHLSVPLARLA